MQIAIINGIYTDNGPDVRTSYPVNMVPIALQNGTSTGYLRPGNGIETFGTGPGVDRGGIEWDGICYRVMGSKLVRVDADGTVTVLGDVGGGTELVTMDYSFTLLAIASGGNLFYWDGTTLTQVTDPDLGLVLDVIWIDGYFMTTDGENIVVTELSDPTQVNPLKYGSAEVDPDPVVALLKLRNEAYVVGRHTIEIFDNVGGDFFPFQRIDGAQVPKGAVGTHAFRLRSNRVGSPSLYSGPGILPIRAKNDALRGLSPDLTGGLMFWPAAFRLARPAAFKPPLGFCPSLRVHAGDLAMFRYRLPRSSH